MNNKLQEKRPGAWLLGACARGRWRRRRRACRPARPGRPRPRPGTRAPPPPCPPAGRRPRPPPLCGSCFQSRGLNVGLRVVRQLDGSQVSAFMQLLLVLDLPILAVTIKTTQLLLLGLFPELKLPSSLRSLHFHPASIEGSLV